MTGDNKKKLNEFRNQKAFTLIETLTVIVVLGIIAMVSLPSMMKHNFRRTTVLKVKKMYITLQSSLDKMKIYNDYGDINFRSYSPNSAGASKVYEDFIKPYIKVSYVAGTDTEKKEKIMYCEKPMKLLSGGYHESNYCTKNKYFGVKLNDGSTLLMRGYNNDEIYFSYDINGEKGPNTLGKDIFRFYITPEKNNDFIYPMSQDLLNSCVSKGNGGWECAHWVVVKGNMDYLDCPGNYNWTKNKCNKK